VKVQKNFEKLCCFNQVRFLRKGQTPDTVNWGYLDRFLT